MALDTQNRQLAPVLTCRHMDVGEARDIQSARYCRCRIGDAADRAAAAARIVPERRLLLQLLAADINELIVAHAASLAEAKADEAEARGPDQWRRARAGVLHAASALRDAMDERLRVRAGALAELGVEHRALMAVIDAGLDDYEENGFAGWRPSDELLSALPADVAEFLAPSPRNEAGEQTA